MKKDYIESEAKKSNIIKQSIKNLRNRFFSPVLISIHNSESDITNQINSIKKELNQQIESCKSDVLAIKDIIEHNAFLTKKDSSTHPYLYQDAVTTNRTLKDKIRKNDVIDYEHILEQNYSKLIKPGDTVIDIGAHVGRHLSVFLYLVGDEGQVLAIEPLKSKYEELYKKFDQPNVRILNSALSCSSGEMVFFENEDYPEESGLKKRIYQKSDGNVLERKVNVTTLDEISREIDRLDYLKLDAEGAEIDILNGGIESINRYKPIISVEYGYSSYSVYGLDRSSLYDMARKMNYFVTDVYGNIIYTSDMWNELCDSLYWDYFLVPEKKLNFFLINMHVHKQN